MNETPSTSLFVTVYAVMEPITGTSKLRYDQSYSKPRRGKQTVIVIVKVNVLKSKHRQLCINHTHSFRKILHSNDRRIISLDVK